MHLSNQFSTLSGFPGAVGLANNRLSIYIDR